MKMKMILMDRLLSEGEEIAITLQYVHFFGSSIPLLFTHCKKHTGSKPVILVQIFMFCFEFAANFESPWELALAQS